MIIICKPNIIYICKNAVLKIEIFIYPPRAES